MWADTISIPLVDFEFRTATGKSWGGVEFVGRSIWEFVDAAERFCWSLEHLSQFHILLWVEAVRPVLHFWWQLFLHTFHFTGRVLECKAARHLAHFSLEFLASSRDMPWFKSEFNDGGVGCEGEKTGWVNECLLDVCEECRWHFQIRVESICALVGPLGFTKPLQVATRWQTLSQDGPAQIDCYRRTTIYLLQMDGLV